MERFQAEAKRLVKLRRRLVRELEDFTEDDVTTSRISVLERDLDRIKDLRNEYQDGVEDFLDEFEDALADDPSGALDKWRRDLRVIGQEVKSHADKIRSKQQSLESGAGMSELQKRSLQIQEASLKVQELALKEKQSSNALKAKEKEDEALVFAETESNIFLGEVSVLGELMLEEDWTTVDDLVIGNAMRNLTKCQDQMNRS